MRQATKVRHGRIVELRNLYLKTKTIESLVNRCNQLGVSAPTTRDYIKQVVEDLTNNEIKRRRKIIAQKMITSSL